MICSTPPSSSSGSVSFTDSVQVGVAMGPSPHVRVCNESEWTDHDLVCGECKVRVPDLSGAYEGRCDNFCQAQGRDCEGAWEGGGGYQRDVCTVARTRTCGTPFTNVRNAICKCSSGSAMPVPIQGKQFLFLGLQSSVSQCAATGRLRIELDSVDLLQWAGVPGGVVGTVWAQKSPLWTASGLQLQVWAQEPGSERRVNFTVLSPDDGKAKSAWRTDEWYRLGASLTGFTRVVLKAEIGPDPTFNQSLALEQAMIQARVFLDDFSISVAGGDETAFDHCPPDIHPPVSHWRQTPGAALENSSAWPPARSNAAVWSSLGSGQTVLIFGGHGTDILSSWG